MLATGQSRSRRVASRDGRAHYLMRVLPYLTVERTDRRRARHLYRHDPHRRSRSAPGGAAAPHRCDAAVRARHGRTQPAARSGLGRAPGTAAGAGRHLQAGVGSGLGAGAAGRAGRPGAGRFRDRARGAGRRGGAAGAGAGRHRRHSRNGPARAGGAGGGGGCAFGAAGAGPSRLGGSSRRTGPSRGW